MDALRSNDRSKTLDTSDYTLAFEMTEKSPDDTDGTSFVRVQYYLAERKKGAESVTYKWVNTTTCKSLIEKHSWKGFLDLEFN